MKIEKYLKVIIGLLAVRVLQGFYFIYKTEKDPEDEFMGDLEDY